ncbi:hypothetical protein AAKU64_004137 [Undibacterium sp. GrIS 1.8]|uniref:DUF3560 domain-containing protein n=1 Tax=Undibacterium sp. GrIS 1.8 TaxID=3143934 RepID=UPI0033955219
MNHYEAKQEARRARFEELASQAQTQSTMIFTRTQKLASVIPFGQPILIDHHSEGRDRNFRAKIHRSMDKAHELSKTAAHYESRAASVGRGGISSDDPDALAKLRGQLDGLEAMQEKMKKTNSLLKKDDVAGLAAIGWTPEQIEKLKTPDYSRRVGFPSYALTNNNANMRRIKDRIQELGKAATRADKEEQGEGYTYREDTAENRVMFEFDGKPAEEVRNVLKRNGFKWSPNRGAWVRQLNNAGIYAGELVRKMLDKNI